MFQITSSEPRFCGTCDQDKHHAALHDLASHQDVPPVMAISSVADYEATREGGKELRQADQIEVVGAKRDALHRSCHDDHEHLGGHHRRDTTQKEASEW